MSPGCIDLDFSSLLVYLQKSACEIIMTQDDLHHQLQQEMRASSNACLYLRREWKHLFCQSNILNYNPQTGFSQVTNLPKKSQSTYCTYIIILCTEDTHHTVFKWVEHTYKNLGVKEGEDIYLECGCISERLHVYGMMSSTNKTRHWTLHMLYCIKSTWWCQRWCHQVLLISCTRLAVWWVVQTNFDAEPTSVGLAHVCLLTSGMKRMLCDDLNWLFSKVKAVACGTPSTDLAVRRAQNPVSNPERIRWFLYDNCCCALLYFYVLFR